MQALNTIYISKKPIRPCHHCGEPIPNRWAKKFCSRECSYLAKTEVKTLNCLKCNKEFKQKALNQKFCSKDCSYLYKRLRPPMTEEQKVKISKTLKRKYANGEISAKSPKSYSVVYFKRCDNCDNLFTFAHQKGNKLNKTCSRECGIELLCKRTKSIFNGKRTTKYFNPYQNKIINLDSSWEVKVANFLCDNNIEWIRPSYIKWIDSTGKKRMYFPDFYLPEYNLYLDPKNPICMKRDEEKMSVIETMIDIVYGDVDYVIESLLYI